MEIFKFKGPGVRGKETTGWTGEQGESVHEDEKYEWK